MIEEKINLGLFEDFFELSLSADYAKMLINTENLDKNKEFLAAIKDRISDFKRQNKRNEWNRKTNKNADETLNIIEKILDDNVNPQKNFLHASKVDKGKSELKFKKSIAESVKLKNEKIAEIKKRRKKQKTICLKNDFTNYQSPSDMYKKLRDTEGKKNEDRVEAIKKC